MRKVTISKWIKLWHKSKKLKRWTKLLIWKLSECTERFEIQGSMQEEKKEEEEGEELE